jgi:hypothetical protein
VTISALKLRRPKVSSPPLLRLAANTYVTDERKLFRCVSAAPASEPGATALLEDCLTLEHLVFPLDQLDPEKLRVVKTERMGGCLSPATRKSPPNARTTAG